MYGKGFLQYLLYSAAVLGTLSGCASLPKSAEVYLSNFKVSSNGRLQHEPPLESLVREEIRRSPTNDRSNGGIPILTIRSK